MDKPDAPAVVSGSTVKVSTLADDTLRVVIDVEPRHAQVAFAMFGTRGTPVAIARLVPEAAQQAVQREAAQAHGWGLVYTALYKSGWWHNPRVARAYGVSEGVSPDDRIATIKSIIYGTFDIESLTELEPQYFVADCDALGIRDTLPASVIEAAKGRAI